MDIVPLTLEETEQYVFRKVKVKLDDLNLPLKHAIERIIDETVGCYNSLGNHYRNYKDLVRDLRDRVEEFNNQIQDYTGHSIAKALLIVVPFKTIENNASYVAYVEYHGVDQDTVFDYPDSLRNQIYSKYFKGFQAFQKQCQSSPEYLKGVVESTVKNSFNQFKGMKCTSNVLDQIKEDIKKALIGTNIVEEIQFSFNSYKNIDIRCRTTYPPNLININVAIS